jgi:predicted cation transporter
MSSAPYERSGAAETLAGFLAAASIFTSLTGVAYRPLRLIPLAILLALIAGAIGGRHERLASYAVYTGAACFAVGLAAAVITSNPLW